MVRGTVVIRFSLPLMLGAIMAAFFTHRETPRRHARTRFVVLLYKPGSWEVEKTSTPFNVVGEKDRKPPGKW